MNIRVTRRKPVPEVWRTRRVSALQPGDSFVLPEVYVVSATFTNRSPFLVYVIVS